MKVNIYKIFAILGIFFGFAVVSVQAQAPSRVEVNIPFEFSAGKTTLKPGVYSIKRMSGNLLSLRNTEDKSEAVILNAPVNLTSTDPNAVERLVFSKDGERYLLSQIWLTVDTGRQLPVKTNAPRPELMVLSFRTTAMNR
jgi:hypothetical protein